MAGMSEEISRVCRKFNIRVVFKFGQTLHSLFAKVYYYLLVSNLLYPLQLCPGLHRGDQTETGDKTEGAPRCLRDGDNGEVGCTGACMGEPSSDPMGGDHSAGSWQRTETVGEGGPHIQMIPSECLNH